MSRPFASLGLLSFVAGANLFAGGSVIGVAVSDTSLVVNKTSVSGNANLSEGTSIQTGGSTGRLRMMDGSYVLLSRESEGKVFENRLVLERGASQVTSRSGYSVEALGVRIAPQVAARADVRLESGRVVVSAVNGPVKVWNSAGVPVASMTPGRTLSFQPTASGSASSLMRGTVTREGGRFVLPDEASGLKVELRGTGLDRELGKRVQVSGVAVPSSDKATQVVNVAKLTRLEEEPMPGGAPNPAPNPVPAAAAAASAGVVIGIIVVAAFTAGISTYFATTNDPPVSR